MAADLVDGRSWVEKAGIAILRSVARVAHVAAQPELDCGDHRTEVALLKCRRCSGAGYVLGRADLNKVDPIDLCCTTLARTRKLAPAKKEQGKTEQK